MGKVLINCTNLLCIESKESDIDAQSLIAVYMTLGRRKWLVRYGSAERLHEESGVSVRDLTQI